MYIHIIPDMVMCENPTPLVNIETYMAISTLVFNKQYGMIGPDPSPSECYMPIYYTALYVNERH